MHGNDRHKKYGTVHWHCEDGVHWEAKIECARDGDTLHFRFHHKEHPLQAHFEFEGKFSLEAKLGKQTNSGIWYYDPPTTKYLTGKFEGVLKRFRKQIRFDGTWLDEEGKSVFTFQLEKGQLTKRASSKKRLLLLRQASKSVRK